MNGFANWVSDPANMRRFAFWNVVFWALNQMLIPFWYFLDRKSWNESGTFYIAVISISALWLSSLAWWQSIRVEQKMDDES